MMMSNTIKALSKREDALLESPTGSGKTMALLCASLAWQQTEAANLQVREPISTSLEKNTTMHSLPAALASAPSPT